MAEHSGTTHHLVVGTFRHPYLYTLEFSAGAPSSNALKIVSRHSATGGHSWLHLDDAKTVLYCTGWTQPPSLAAYSIEKTGNPSPPISLKLLNQAYPKYLSGYVTVDEKALYSASGPQGDVFALDPTTGGFASQQLSGERGGELKTNGPIQSFSFLSPAEQEAIERGENSGNIMDFGGLRHGGHVGLAFTVKSYTHTRAKPSSWMQSADLSPDGKRLYVADMQVLFLSPISPQPMDNTYARTADGTLYGHT
ncbi:hypothetical protein QFC21_003142 [Naganishia friedmannii]|uniref:Uncharacterized protein n=1 Tax=Naganishia friedmannii TaxID=89922 RepID=A0ACC2VRK0_9TREE|nr:hypothetical protein QFC21_003142 [Naganishia friedmannii]